jgi:hypothetical protein
MYHTHWHDEQQLVNGVYGPLIVLEPGQQYDAEHDKIFLFSTGKLPDPLGLPVLLNGSPQPVPERLPAGEKYRYSVDQHHCGLSGYESVALRIRPSNAVEKTNKRWRRPSSALAVMASAQERLTAGERRETAEFQSENPTELQLEAYQLNARRRCARTGFRRCKIDSLERSEETGTAEAVP